MVTEAQLDGVFKAISDPTRRAILEALRSRKLPVQAIAERFPDMSRPAISKHLRILREAGMVEEEQRGRERHYHLVARSLEPLAAWLAPMRSRPDLGQRAATSRVASAAGRRSRAIDDWRVW